MWLIYASEVSSCVGKNVYKKQWEVFENIFKRLDQGLHFKLACERLKQQSINVTTTEENSEKVIEKVGLKNEVKEFLANSVNSSKKLDEKVVDIKNKIKTKKITFKDEFEKTKQNLSEANKTLESFEKKIKLHHQENELLNKEITRTYSTLSTVGKPRSDESAKEIELTLTNPGNPPDISTSPSPIPLPTEMAVLVKKREETERMLNETRKKKEEISQQCQEMISYMNDQQKLIQELEKAEKSIISQKQRVYGQEKEKLIIESRLVGPIEDNNTSFYKIVLGEQPIRWGVGGRIDGFRNGQLIEIKNRKNKFFNPLPIYDFIQVQTYMHILNLQQAVVIQCLVEEDGRIKRDEQTIDRDHHFWETEVQPYLDLFVKSLYFFVHQKLVQDQLFAASSDRDKSLVLKKIFQYATTNSSF
jgi:hypothetical protein